MTRKLILTLLCLFLFLNLSANDRAKIALNRHFVPLQKSQHDTAFIKISNPITDGKQVERIYDLDNKLVRIVTKYFENGKNPTKTVWEDVDASGQVYKIKERKNNENNYTIYYLHKGKVIAEFYGNEQEVIFGKKIVNEEKVVTSTNIFEPGFKKSVVDYQEFIRQNLQYPVEARKKRQQGTVELALEIKADGSIGRIEVVNAGNVSPLLQEEAVRVLSLYTDGFRSAVDMEGNPVTKWLYLPIHFKLG
jgi:TonB family protein